MWKLDQDWFVASGSSVRRLQGAEENWAWRAITETAWHAGLALDAGEGRVYALDLLNQQLRTFGSEGTQMQPITLTTSGYEAFVMLALFPEVTLWMTLALGLVGIIGGAATDALVPKVLVQEQECDQSFSFK